MMSGRRVVDGIGVLGAEHLIPFKCMRGLTFWTEKEPESM
mgnify:CR=1 FL=1